MPANPAALREFKLEPGGDVAVEQLTAGMKSCAWTAAHAPWRNRRRC
ncbi:MAG: hypothetical protein JXM70_24645 [Pirellulales bacterium]|nr:hypothetical protein [Pirellulales bacterium]